MKLIAVAAVVAVVAIVTVFGNSARGGTEAADVPVVAAEAVALEDGVKLTVRGEHFEPGGTVNLTWSDTGNSVTADVFADGTLFAVIDLPSDDEQTAHELVVDDGEHVARQVYAVGAEPSGAVLGVGAGTKVSVNGGSYFLLGANYPWVNYGNDFGSNAWGSYGVHSGGSYEADFADMASKGVHVARWWVFADGRAGINWSSDGTPTGVQPVVYEDLNRALALARKYNIYLDLVLFDVSLLSRGNTVSGVKMGGHTDAIADSTKRAALLNNVIKPLAQAYASDPMVVAWEIMNEPEWGIADLPHPAVDPNYAPVTMSQFWAFASGASNIVHFYAQDQVTIGSASLKWNKVWTNAFAQSRGLPVLNLDFYQTHYYQWMDCCRTDDPVLGNTHWSPLIQPAYELGLDKPIVVGEIYTPWAGAREQLNEILANGYAGFWGWSYKYENTGDKMQIDWDGFEAWERDNASIVRIPPPGSAGPAPTATATKAAATATKTFTNTATKTATKPASTATKTPTSVKNTATATKSATPTKTAVNPTPTPVNVPSGTLKFDDLPNRNTRLNGHYPLGTIDWGRGDWFVSGPWGGFTTNSISVGSTVKSSTLAFVDGSGRLLSLQAYNGGSDPSTVRLECGANVPREVVVNPGQMLTISTGWTLNCAAVDVYSSNGWHTNFDNLVYATDGAVVNDDPTVEPSVSVPENTTITAVASSTPTHTPTRTPTNTPVPSGTKTVTFNDLPNPDNALSGEYPSGTINWGSNAWWLSIPWGSFTSNSISFNGVGPTFAQFTFVTPRRLISVEAHNVGISTTTVTLACSGNTNKVQDVAPGQVATITTAWSNNCTNVTVFSTNGWDTNFDNFVITGSAPSATATPTPSPAPTTGAPTATATQGGSTGPCAGDCGIVRNFCETTGPWAMCNDYEQLGDTSFEVPFPPASEPASMDCLDSTNASYLPHQHYNVNGQQFDLGFPCAFSKHEHFMTRVESGSFGQAILRFHQPLTVPSSGERHITFELDMKGRQRNYTRVMLSPDLTKRLSDDRGGDARYPMSFIDMWIRNGNVEGTICSNGSCIGDSYPFGDAFSSCNWGGSPGCTAQLGPDNVRYRIDVYLSRTSLRMQINGIERVNTTFPALNFDRAYLYLSQVSYNPCKDGQCSKADQIFHWDSVAFDGPALPRNGLTPAGSQDVVFNAYGPVSCSVKGYPAQKTSPHASDGYTWQTWVARMPVQTASLSDVSCVPGAGTHLNRDIMGFEIVKQP